MSKTPLLDFKLLIADRVFAIQAEFLSIPDKYEPYFAPEGAEVDYHIFISEADIMAQYAKKKPPTKRTAAMDFQSTGVDFPFSFLIQDRIARLLLDEDVLFMHASALRYEGRAYVFSAPSGTGKSTHTRLWRETFGDAVTMINDDKILMRLDDQGAVTVYGTPWRGKHLIGENISAPLQGIAFIAKHSRDRIVRLEKHQALWHLYHMVYTWDDDAATSAKVFALTGKLADAAPLWFLGCTKDHASARFACTAMKGTG